MCKPAYKTAKYTKMDNAHQLQAKYNRDSYMCSQFEKSISIQLDCALYARDT